MVGLAHVADSSHGSPVDGDRQDGGQGHDHHPDDRADVLVCPLGPNDTDDGEHSEDDHDEHDQPVEQAAQTSGYETEGLSEDVRE